MRYSRGGGGSYRGGGGGSNFNSALSKPNWDSSSLFPFQKNFYREHPGVACRSQREIDEHMNANRIKIDQSRLRPIMHFNEVGFPPQITTLLANMKFERPTPIQSASWPILLSGSDLVGIAQTGSGKTLSFMLPAIVQATSQGASGGGHSRSSSGPSILVLAPTRELAQQIQSVANDFGMPNNCRNCCVYGGAPRGSQIHQYGKGVEILIATPGRLIDFLSSGEVNLKRVTFLILDEADRMLDMGFEPQIRKIIGQLRPDRQTCMFSATWPNEVRRLANDFLTQPAQITIGDTELSANHNITQIVEVCSERDKDHKIRSVLHEIMKETRSKTIVFAQTKKRVRQYHKMLSMMGLPVMDIHGDKKQHERDRTLRDFREQRRAILIATDVASRGLDVEDVKFVVNIDYPPQTEDYIHRIGRTARSNHHGTSYTFFTDKNAKEAGNLVKVLREANQPIPDKLLDFTSHRGGYRRVRDRSPQRDDYDRKRTRYDAEDYEGRVRKYDGSASQPSSTAYPGATVASHYGQSTSSTTGSYGQTTYPSSYPTAVGASSDYPQSAWPGSQPSLGGSSSSAVNAWPSQQQYGSSRAQVVPSALPASAVVASGQPTWDQMAVAAAQMYSNVSAVARQSGQPAAVSAGYSSAQATPGWPHMAASGASAAYRPGY